MKLEKKDLEAWDERFNHIDDFHFKRGERIDDWYPLDRDIPKGLLRNEHVLDSGVPSSFPVETESDEETSDSTQKSDSPQSPTRTPPSEAYNEEIGCRTKGSWYCVSTVY